MLFTYAKMCAGRSSAAIMAQTQIKHFTFVIHSEQRDSGDATNYTITIPPIPPGDYKITCRLVLAHTPSYIPPYHDVQIRMKGISALATGIPDGYHHVMTSAQDSQCTGVIFAHDPGNELGVRFIQLRPAEPARMYNIGVHSIHCEFERL
jgi:hypothetical protein